MSELETGADSIRKFLHELDIRIRARYPLIAINTFEEDRVREALVDLVFQERHKEKPLYFLEPSKRPSEGSRSERGTTKLASNDRRYGRSRKSSWLYQRAEDRYFPAV